MVCGIDFGSENPDRPGVIARPTIGHILPKERGGSDDLDNLRPECQFCNETARNLTETPVDENLVIRQMNELGREDKRTLVQWMLAGRRSFTQVEQLWSQYTQLPEPKREAIRKALSAELD